MTVTKTGARTTDNTKLVETRLSKVEDKVKGAASSSDLRSLRSRNSDLVDRVAQLERVVQRLETAFKEIGKDLTKLLRK